MNKSKLNKVVSLNKDGISFQLCISMLVQLSKSPNEAGQYIEEFIKIRAPQIWADLTKDKTLPPEGDAVTIEDE